MTRKTLLVLLFLALVLGMGSTFASAVTARSTPGHPQPSTVPRGGFALGNLQSPIPNPIGCALPARR